MLLILSYVSFLHADHVRKFGENHGSCQAGMSSFYIGVCIEDTKHLVCVCVYI